MKAWPVVVDLVLIVLVGWLCVRMAQVEWLIHDLQDFTREISRAVH